MDLLNRRYVGTGISFTLLSVTRILSRLWHEIIDGEVCVLQSTTHTNLMVCWNRKETSYMYRLFHKGGSVHLNVYTVGFYGTGLNGYAILPVSYATRPYQDGVVLQYATVPGGTSRERQGSTLVHEAGHWLGLRHTFEGGCVGVGDGVDDTAPEADAASGCPIGRKSCPNSDLPDPIRKYSSFFFCLDFLRQFFFFQTTSWITRTKPVERNSHKAKLILCRGRLLPTVATLTFKTALVRWSMLCKLVVNQLSVNSLLCYTIPLNTFSLNAHCDVILTPWGSVFI